jgi:hypothetical protein
VILPVRRTGGEDGYECMDLVWPFQKHGISRALGIARDTVRKVLQLGLGAREFLYKRTVQPQGKLGAWSIVVKLPNYHFVSPV